MPSVLPVRECRQATQSPSQAASQPEEPHLDAVGPQAEALADLAAVRPVVVVRLEQAPLPRAQREARLGEQVKEIVALEDQVPIEFSIVARNLADVRGQNHVSFNKDDVQLPGQSIRFGLRAQF